MILDGRQTYKILVHFVVLEEFLNIGLDVLANLKLPDTVTNMDGSFGQLNYYGSGPQFDITHIFDDWITPNRSRNLRITFASRKRNYSAQ